MSFEQPSLSRLVELNSLKIRHIIIWIFRLCLFISLHCHIFGDVTLIELKELFINLVKEYLVSPLTV